MSINDLLQWWNLIYAVPLVVSLVWIVATIASGTDSGADHGGHDFGHDGHADVAADGHGDHLGDSHSDGQDSSHGEGDHHHAVTGDKLLVLLGLNRVPVTLIIGVFMLFWGAFGLVLNRALEGSLRYPAVYIWPSMLVTLVLTIVLTRITAAVVARVMPGTESYATRRTGLIGLLGHAVYKVTESSGTVNVKDTYGTVHRVQAKTEPEADPLGSGVEVIIVDFDEEDRRYVVRESAL